MEKYQELEVKFAEWNELDPEGMVACSSGTAALHLAFEAMQLPLGSQVIVPDLTMVACPRAVMLAGLVPRFVDCDDRLLMEWSLTDKMFGTLANPLSAVMFVHVYGRKMCIGDDRFVNDDGFLPVIEDLAEAHGVRPNDRTDAACWSFYKNKIIHGEEGGAVYFRDLEHAKRARSLRSLGFTDDHDFTHIPRGHNYRMSNCHAELILKSLAEADENIQKRQQIEYWYTEKIIPEMRLPARNAVWVYDLRVPTMEYLQQNRLVKSLNEMGVAARHCFKPMTLQEEWRYSIPECPSGMLSSPNASRLSQEVIYLPVQPQMTQQDVSEIVNKFTECLGRSAQS